MGTSDVTVTTPDGTQQVPASVVDAPGGGLSYPTTGSGNNPTGGAVANKLPAKLARTSYPGVLAAVASSEYRETANDASQVNHINDLLAVMKSLQDGTFNQLMENDKYQALAMNLIEKVPAGTKGIQAKLSNAEGSKADLNALRQVVANQTRIAYAAVGVNTTGTNYQSLANAGASRLPELQQQEASSRGTTAPLAPLTRTTDLVNLLDDLESGKSTANINPQVYATMMQKAGVPGGGQGNGYLLATGGHSGLLGPGALLAPPLVKALQRVTVQAIQTHMLNLAGPHPGSDFVNEVKSANSAQALKAVTLPSHLHAMAGTDGYNLDKVNTFGSFFTALQTQSVKTASGLGIPGEEVKVPGKAAAAGSGQQFFDAFKTEWARSSAYRDEVAAALNTAGISATTIGSASADYASAANALLQVMGKTPAGENPWAYLKAQPTISDAELHANQGYAIALAEATKIGAKLTNDQLNRLAQIYGGSSTTGNTDALDQAIASMYRYDPNTDTQPGSFAQTALTDIKQTFGSYGIELTDAQAGGYVQQLLTKGGADLTSIYSAGDAAEAYATQEAQKAAMSLFPTLAPLINSGTTLTGSGGALTPYLTQYANMLGKDPDTISLTPQLIKLMAAGTTGTSSSVGLDTIGAGQALASGTGQKGAPTAQAGLKSLDQFQAAVMQDPTTGWDKSPNALEAYTNMGNSLMSTMGFAPPQGAQTPGAPQTSNLAGGEV